MSEPTTEAGRDYDVVTQEGTYSRTVSGTGQIMVVADPLLAVVPRKALEAARAVLGSER